MKFTNESAAGARRAAAMNKPERAVDDPGRGAVAPAVDPSVRLGPLKGEPRGCVPINSPAYTGKFKRG